METPSKRYSVTCGKISKEEEEYLIAKGLKFENSRGELLEISTDVEDTSYSSLLSESQQESLMVFEDNEKLFEQESSSKGPIKNSDGSTKWSKSFNQSLSNCMEAIQETDQFVDEENKENVHFAQPQFSLVDKDGSIGVDEESPINSHKSRVSTGGPLTGSLSKKGKRRSRSMGIADESMISLVNMSKEWVRLNERLSRVSHDGQDESLNFEESFKPEAEISLSAHEVVADAPTEEVEKEQQKGEGVVEESFVSFGNMTKEWKRLSESSIVPCTQYNDHEDSLALEVTQDEIADDAPKEMEKNENDSFAVNVGMELMTPLKVTNESFVSIGNVSREWKRFSESSVVVPCTQYVSHDKSHVLNETFEKEEEEDIIPSTQDIVAEDPKEENSSDTRVASFSLESMIPTLGNNSVKGITEETFLSVGDVSSEWPREKDNYIAPCIQDDEIHDRSLNGSYQVPKFLVPPTPQAPVQCDDSMMDESIELVPCTQAYPETDAEASNLDISSVPCSQESAGLSGSSKEDLDDTLTLMTKLLALADEQEAKEKAETERLQQTETEAHSMAEDDASILPTEPEKEVIQPKEQVPQDEVLFKTPLKHSRVLSLKSKQLCTPSPPRTYVNTLLERGALRKTEVINKPVMIKPNKVGSPKPPNATAGRTPLANITPVKPRKTITGTSTPRTFKTPVASKVDSGLRKHSPFSVGLSPVANYIYSKPAPSTFARVQGIQKQTKTNIPTASLNSSVTRIPSRISQAQAPPKTPNSPKRLGPLRTSTFFDTTCTPPKIVSNEVVDVKKRFQPLQYTGSTKVKVVNSKVNSPQTDYVAHRHTGLRDESGNASFIQNTFIEKKNIPHSRLVTPKSVKRV